MINFIIERIPGMMTLFYAILAYIIPVTVYKVNKKIHANYDPPWKKQNQNNNQRSSRSIDLCGKVLCVVMNRIVWK